MPFFEDVAARHARQIADAASPDNLGAMREEAPCVAASIPVGGGKTAAVIRQSVDFVTDPAAAWGRRVAVLAPTHALAGEVAARFKVRAPNVSVLVVRGAAQPDPDAPGEVMCRRADLAASARREGASMDDICRSCPFREQKTTPAGCGYRGQRTGASGAQIVIFAGNGALADRVPKWLRREPEIGQPGGGVVLRDQFDAVVIDEPVFDQLVHGLDRAEIGETCLPFAEIEAPDFLTASGVTLAKDEDARLVAASSRCRPPLRALVTVGAGASRRAVTVGELAAEGLDAARARHLAGVVLDAKLKVTDWSDTPPADEAARRKHNAQVLRVHRMLGAVGDWLTRAGRCGPHEPCGALVFDDAPMAGGHGRVPALAYRWREDINDDWRVPTLIVDATLSPEIVREWYPDAVLAVSPPVWAPPGCVRVRQCSDQALSLSRLASLGDQFAARVARHVEIETARRRGMGRDGIDTLVVAPKSFVAALRRAWGGTPPTGIEVAHFGALRGLDRWGGVAFLLVVGRLLPPLGAAEEFAAVVAARSVPPARDWVRDTGTYAMADGSARLT